MPEAGDVFLAVLGGKPSRWFIRRGRARPVAHLWPLYTQDDYGAEWLYVLPLEEEHLRTRLNPRHFVWVRADGIGAPITRFDRQQLAALERVLDGQDPRYPWIQLIESPWPIDNPSLSAGPDPMPPERYPTIGQVLQEPGADQPTSSE